jgi:hypothetical protein
LKHICAVEKILACPLLFNRNPVILGMCCNIVDAKWWHSSIFINTWIICG